MPALFTRTSILPNASTAAAMRRSGSSGLEMSQGTASVRPPAWLISLATSSSASLRRAAMTTLAPSAANSLAMAAPTPEFAPVTTATLPSSLLMMVPLLLGRARRPATCPRCDPGRPTGRSVEDAGQVSCKFLAGGSRLSAAARNLPGRRSRIWSFDRVLNELTAEFGFSPSIPLIVTCGFAAQLSSNWAQPRSELGRTTITKRMRPVDGLCG